MTMSLPKEVVIVGFQYSQPEDYMLQVAQQCTRHGQFFQSSVHKSIWVVDIAFGNLLHAVP